MKRSPALRHDLNRLARKRLARIIMLRLASVHINSKQSDSTEFRYPRHGWLHATGLRQPSCGVACRSSLRRSSTPWAKSQSIKKLLRMWLLLFASASQQFSNGFQAEGRARSLRPNAYLHLKEAFALSAHVLGIVPCWRFLFRGVPRQSGACGVKASVSLALSAQHI